MINTLAIGYFLVVFWGSAWACDDYSWEEVNQRFQSCIQARGLELLKPDRNSRPENCRKMKELQGCFQWLELCLDEQQLSDDIPFRFDLRTSEWEKNILACENVRSKRSPGKRGRSRARTAISRTVSRIRNRGRSPSSPSRPRSGLLGGLLGNKKGLATAAGGAYVAKKGLSKGGLGKGKTLKKVGKYAVAGLAAYGAYKVAKKMSKGLRHAYDEDECWQYSFFHDQYTCVCEDECEVYVGAAPAAVVANALLVAASVLTTTVATWRRL